MRFLSFSLAALVAVSMSGCAPDEKAASQTATDQNSAKVIPSLTDDEKKAVAWLFETGDEDLENPDNAAKLDTLAAINEEALKKYLTDCNIETSLICGIKDKGTFVGLEFKDWNSASKDLKTVLREDIASLIVSHWNIMKQTKERLLLKQELEAGLEAIRKKILETLAASSQTTVPNSAKVIPRLTAAEKAASQTAAYQNSPKEEIPSLTDDEKAAVTWLYEVGVRDLQNPDNAAKVATLAAINGEALKNYLTDCDIEKGQICVETLISLDRFEEWNSAPENLKNVLRKDIASFTVSHWKIMKVLKEGLLQKQAMEAGKEAIRKKFLVKLAAEKEAKQNSLSTV